MTYDSIMGILGSIEMLLGNVSVEYAQREEAAQALVDLHNTYCEETNNIDDYIYDNTDDELTQLLPSDPIQAFYEGRNSNDYSPNDDWLSLDGYGHPTSCTPSMLVDKFVFLSDLARWLEDKDDDEQQELLSELIELAHEYNKD